MDTIGRDSSPANVRATLIDAQELRIEDGKTFQDRYFVLKTLGEGASGRVYLCSDKLLGDLPVAIKIFPSEVRLRSTDAARIEQEILAINRVDHPNVVRFYDCFVSQKEVGIVMEYVAGGTLKELLDSSGTVPEATVINIARQIARGLDAIHSLGMLHRDLKLENILLTETGNVKITDLGLALKISSCDTLDLAASYSNSDIGDFNLDKRLTKGNNIVGTPLYLSPEYLEHGYQDERSDLYALGILCFELINGKSPWHEASLAQLIRLKVEKDPPPLDRISTNCSPQFSTLVVSILAREPKLRPANAKELLQRLESLNKKETLTSGSRRKQQITATPQGIRSRKKKLHLFTLLAVLLIACMAIHYLLYIVTPERFKSVITSPKETPTYRLISPKRSSKKPDS